MSGSRGGTNVLFSKRKFQALSASYRMPSKQCNRFQLPFPSKRTTSFIHSPLFQTDIVMCDTLGGNIYKKDVDAQITIIKSPEELIVLVQFHGINRRNNSYSLHLFGKLIEAIRFKIHMISIYTWKICLA